MLEITIINANSSLFRQLLRGYMYNCFFENWASFLAFHIITSPYNEPKKIGIKIYV